MIETNVRAVERDFFFIPMLMKKAGATRRGLLFFLATAESVIRRLRKALCDEIDWGRADFAGWIGEFMML